MEREKGNTEKANQKEKAKTPKEKEKDGLPGRTITKGATKEKAKEKTKERAKETGSQKEKENTERTENFKMKRSRMATSVERSVRSTQDGPRG